MRVKATGFGTMEVLIALPLLGVVLIGITGLLMGAVSAGATSEAFSAASNVARQCLEQVTDTMRRFGTAGTCGTATVGGRQYSLSVTPSAPDALGVVDVVVTATFNVAFGSPCVSGNPVCAGNVRTYSRTLQTRVRRP